MSQSVLPPIRDILPGYLHEYPNVSPSPSPPLSSHPLPPLYTTPPHLPIQDPVQRRSPSETTRGLSSTKYWDRSPRSISSFIPTPSFQFNNSSKGPSPTLADSVTRRRKRAHTSSSDGSAPSAHSTGGQQSDSDAEGQDHPATSKKRRREEKKHACPYCKKLFHRPVSLGVHINTHTGEKPYTCPFPNCSRQFNVNSNMRRHYRTHFTPGTIDLSELTYSSADERFYVHATTPTTVNPARGRFGPTSPYIPPMPSVSYGQISPYPGPNASSIENPSRPYTILPISYIPVHHRPTIDVKYNTAPEQEAGDDWKESPIRVGRLKPASDWNRGRREEEPEEDDEFDGDEGEEDVGEDEDDLN